MLGLGLGIWRATPGIGGGAAETISTWNTSDASSGWTLSNGDRTVQRSGAGWISVRGSKSHTSGKRYFEIRMDAADATSDWMMGIGSSGMNVGSFLGNSTYGLGIRLGDNFENGFTDVGSVVLSFFAAAGVGRFAVDFTAGKVWVGKNGTWLASGDPGAGTNHAYTFTPATVGALLPAISGNSAAIPTLTLLTAASQFEQSVPSGFSAWGG